MNIIITLALILFAWLLDWQKDKSSGAIALEKNWLKYVAMAIGGIFLFGFLFNLPAVRYIFAGLVVIGIYFFWSFLSQSLTTLYYKLFRKKT